MSKKKHKRWRLFADPRVQGQFCLRVVIYWLVCQVTFFGAMLAFASVGGKESISPAALMNLAWPAFIMSILALPFALLDAVGFSNRFAGPVLNFRRRFADLAQGKDVGEMSFRPGDYYSDLSENFNKLRTRVGSSDPVAVEQSTTADEVTVGN